MNRVVVALAWIIHALPHPFGVSPLGATALYAGACGDRRTAWLVPLAPLALTTLFVRSYPAVVMVCVFAGFALATLMGRLWLAERRSIKRFAAAVGSGALAFFLVSNAGVWLAGYFPATAAGLVECYVAGLPFLGLSLLADATYTMLLFGLHALAPGREPSTASA